MAGNVRTKAGVLGNAMVVYQSGGQIFFYIANFGDGTVDVFDRHKRQVSSFRDPSLPPNYAPVDLQLIDSNLFVTLVDRDVCLQDLSAEPKHGVIAEFNLDGVLLDRAQFSADASMAPHSKNKCASGQPAGMSGESRPAAPASAADRRRSQS